MLQGTHHQLAYVADPTPLPRGELFALEVIACRFDGSIAPEVVTVDALMPDHGHGMTYQPKAHRTGPGHWRVEGLMLHMQGRWTLSFELGSGSLSERITDELLLK